VAAHLRLGTFLLVFGSGNVYFEADIVCYRSKWG